MKCRIGELSVSTQWPLHVTTSDCCQGNLALWWGTGANLDPGLCWQQLWTRLLELEHFSTFRCSTPPELAACFRLRLDTSCAPRRQAKIIEINNWCFYYVSLHDSIFKDSLLHKIKSELSDFFLPLSELLPLQLLLAWRAQSWWASRQRSPHCSWKMSLWQSSRFGGVGEGDMR